MMKVIFHGKMKIESGQVVTKDYWFQKETEMKTEELMEGVREYFLEQFVFKIFK